MVNSSREEPGLKPNVCDDLEVFAETEYLPPIDMQRKYESFIPDRSEIEKNASDGNLSVCIGLADRLKKCADSLYFNEDISSRYRKAWSYWASASIYFLAAQYTSEPEESISLYHNAGRVFHFAGHAFRKEEEYRWAGESYQKSGTSFKECLKKQLQSGAEKDEIFQSYDDVIRSFRRAKGVFGDVGDYDLSGLAYYEEQKAISGKLLKQRSVFWFLRIMWAYLTGYGERLGRWLISYILGIFIFTIVIMREGFSTSLSFSTAAARSLLIPVSVGNVWIMIAQYVYSYFVLGFALTILARKMQSR